MSYINRPDFLGGEQEEAIQEEQPRYVKNPLSQHEMDGKLDEIRKTVSQKMDRWANRIVVSMAFTPKVKRTEGEQWIENGKTWELKNGIAQTIRSTQGAIMPHWCPKCTKPMNHRFDRKFYYIRNWCYDCNVNWEGQMRLDGTYDEWEQSVLRANEIDYLKDQITETQEFIRNFAPPTLYFESGEIMALASKSDFAETLEQAAKGLENMIARLEFLLSNGENVEQTTASSEE